MNVALGRWRFLWGDNTLAGNRSSSNFRREENKPPCVSSESNANASVSGGDLSGLGLSCRL